MLSALVLLVAACSREAPAAPAEAAPAPQTETAAPVAPAPEAGPIRVYDARAVRSFPHDTRAFTQGLFFADGALFESTGKRGASVIRRLDLRDGSAVAEVRLPDEVFGEGATVVDDRIVSLSWRAGLGFVHDAETLERLGTFPLAGEGWGLAYDAGGDRLILSDGTPRLRFLDPSTYEETGGVDVTLQGRALPRLNELEVIGSEVWANVWQQDFVVRIDPDTGVVTGVIDVSGLFPAEERADPRDDVPNGIAYEEGSGRLFMTGKRWPAVFEVELIERAP